MFFLLSIVRGQGFFLHGNRIPSSLAYFGEFFSKIYLPTETQWESIQEFDFIRKTKLVLGQFMTELQFRNSALRVVEATANLEIERSKEISGIHAVMLVVLYESLNPFSESARNYLKCVCDRILVHATWKLDLVRGLACVLYQPGLSFYISQWNRPLYVLTV